MSPRYEGKPSASRWQVQRRAWLGYGGGLGGVLPDGWAAGDQLFEGGEAGLTRILAAHHIHREVDHLVLHEGHVGWPVLVFRMWAADQQELLDARDAQVGV